MVSVFPIHPQTWSRAATSRHNSNNVGPNDANVVIQWVQRVFLTCMRLRLLNRASVNHLELLFYCALKVVALNWPPFSSCLFRPRLPVLPICRCVNRRPFKWGFKSPRCPPCPVDLCHGKALAELTRLTANVLARPHAAKSLWAAGQS